MPKHNHTIVETYEDMVAFGFSREVDEKSLMYYLQKFSDDDMVRTLIPRLSDEEINACFSLISDLMRKHLHDDEYHRLFLKDEHPHHHHEESCDE
ncbi:MAG: cytoplasmic protein [Syntrophobacter sp.]